MTVEALLQEKLTYLTLKVVPIIALAVLISNLLVEFGLIRRLDFLVHPLVAGARLPRGSGTVIITSLASGTASYSMMANFHKLGKLRETEVIVASIMSSFFQVIHHFFTYYLPVVVPLLGLTTGLLYASIKVAVGLAMTLSAVLIGRIFLRPSGQGLFSPEESRTKRSRRQKAEKALTASLGTLRAILPRLYLVYIAVVFFLATGYLERLGGLAEPLVSVFALPGEAVSIIAVQLFDATSGFVLAGALLQSGELRSFQAVTALLLGTMITLSITYAKHSLPSKVAFFGARLGTRVAAYNLFLQLFFTLLALAVILALL